MYKISCNFALEDRNSHQNFVCKSEGDKFKNRSYLTQLLILSKIMSNFYRNLRVGALGLAISLAASVSAQNSLTIDVSDIKSNDATILITPSNGEFEYYWDITTKAQFEADGGVEKAIDNRIQIWKNHAANYDNTTWQEIMGYELVYGTTYESAAEKKGTFLSNETTYVVYAFGMDRDGNVIAPLAAKNFSTTAPEKSENTFVLAVKSIVPENAFRMTATATATPSNNDTYMVKCIDKVIVDAADLTPGSEGEKNFINEYMLKYFSTKEVVSGPQTFEFDRLKKDTEYCLVAMGLDKDYSPSTSLTTYSFKCEEIKPELMGDITLSVTDITPMNAHFVITPSSDEFRYYFDVTTPYIIEKNGGIDNIPEKLIIDWWKYLADVYGGQYSWTEFMKIQTRTGTLDAMAADLVEEGDLSDLYWNMDWVLYAVGFNESGDVVTNIATCEFHTPENVQEDLDFEFEVYSIEDDEKTTEEYKRQAFTATIDVWPSVDGVEFKLNYMKINILDQYYDEDGEMPEEGWMDFVTRQFLPSAVSFYAPVRLVMPGLFATDAVGVPIEYYVVALGWNEGPSTPIYKYAFDYDTPSGITIKKVVETQVIGGEGVINLYGECDGAAVYSIAGHVMGAIRQGGSIRVPAGLYIVRYTENGKPVSKKVMVK